MIQTDQTKAIPIKPSKKLKTIFQWALYSLSAVLLVPFWWLLSQIFLFKNLSAGTLLSVGLVWLAWTAVVVFALVVIGPLSNLRLYLALVAGVVSALLFFPFSELLLLAAAAFFLGLFVLQYRFAKEEELATKLLLRRILPRSLPPFFTLLSLSIATIYFTSPLLSQGLGFSLPRPIFELTVDTLPFSDNLQQLGVSRELLYQQINHQLQALIEPYGALLPFFFVIGVALTLKALSYPTIWLLVFIEGGLLRLALNLRLVHKDTKLVEKEILRF